MSIEEIKKLIEQFQNSDINEMDLSIPKLSLYLSKHNEPKKITGNTVVTQPLIQQEEVPILNKEILRNQEKSEDFVEVQSITSPIVGVIYTQNQPGDPEFVKKGDKIEVGDTLFIIEAMKIMNEIKSDKAGIVQDILVGNEDMVEFGQTLLTIV